MSEKREYDEEIEYTADAFFNAYSFVKEIENPDEVFERAVFELSNYNIDMDNFYAAALPLFRRLAKQIPRIPIIAAALEDKGIAEEDANILVWTLVETGSTGNYQEELLVVREKFPSLNSYFN